MRKKATGGTIVLNGYSESETARITRVRAEAGTRIDIVHEGEPDRATVTANGIVVDVIANPDGSVYVETYSAKVGQLVVVEHASIDVYRERHPNLRLSLQGEVE